MITVRAINKAVRETDCLYLMGKDQNYRIRRAEKGMIIPMLWTQGRGIKLKRIPIRQDMKFLDGRSGQEISL